MLTVVILGTGNVAEHLFVAFTQSEKIHVAQVVGRNMDRLKAFANNTLISDNFNKIVDADFYIIAVKDDAIPFVSQYLSDKENIVVHTSGAISMDSLKQKNSGVFYPLQTFTKGKSLDFNSIPICIEAKQQSGLQMLRKLGSSISNKVYEISSPQRRKLHLAAVFANNFVNHLYYVSEKICAEEDLPFSLLHPLIKETADKINCFSPYEAQTGPALRDDIKTMESHLHLLKNKKQTELYTLLSEAIKEEHEKKL